MFIMLRSWPVARVEAWRAMVISKVEISGCRRREPQKPVFNGTCMTGGYAITAKGAGQSRFPGHNIGFIQCIIFAEARTGHTIGTAVFIDVAS